MQWVDDPLPVAAIQQSVADNPPAAVPGKPALELVRFGDEALASGGF